MRLDELAERLVVARAGAGKRSLPQRHPRTAFPSAPPWCLSRQTQIDEDPTGRSTEDDKSARTEIGGKAMTQHKVGTQEEWQAARDELLAEEKELTRRSDELARKRRELPWVPVEKEYSFETADGIRPL